MVRRQKTTIFLDAKETTTVGQIKLMVEGILKRPPGEQCLYSGQDEMADDKTLIDYGFTSTEARAQSPGELGLAFKDPETGVFETLDIHSLSTPPELPDVMKLPSELVGNTAPGQPAAAPAPAVGSGGGGGNPVPAGGGSAQQ